MNDLTTFRELVPLDNGLCVVSTVRPDGSVQASVVNAGVIDHPVTAEEVVAFVAAGPAKLRNLRADPRCTVVARAGWRWVAVEGTAVLVGPDDPHPSIDGDRLRLLLREIFKAAGGRHEDWDEYDRAMADERRVAVLVSPLRIYSNPTT
jgi:PPOX class probable F420-dependent enzyme